MPRLGRCMNMHIKSRRQTRSFIQSTFAMTSDKALEASKEPENIPAEAPPSYSPQPEESPKAVINPPPATNLPERVYQPSGPFSSNLTELGSDPANVICPRCQYGVRTQTASTPGAHAGYEPLRSYSLFYSYTPNLERATVYWNVLTVVCGRRLLVLRVDVLPL